MDKPKVESVYSITIPKIAFDQPDESVNNAEPSISSRSTEGRQTVVKLNRFTQYLKKFHRQLYSITENEADTSVAPTRSFRRPRCLNSFIQLHIKDWKKIDRRLIVLRLLVIAGLLAYGTIDTVMYSKNSKDKPDSLKFVHASRYVPLEILTIIYGCGVPALGICVEVYLIIIQAIVNAILVSRICGGSDEAMSAITWAIKLTIFFPAVELCHRNFRKLQHYNDYFNSSTRSMLLQGFFIGLAMLAENLEGLKVVFIETNNNIPHLCKYETSHCGIVNLYEPLFGYENLICVDHLSDYAAGREQLRLLRNFILLNIASFSVFNKHFLKLKSHAKYLWIRILLVTLFTALSTSILISCIDSLFFVRSNCRLVYAIIEVLIFVIIVGLMALNLYQLRHEEENRSEEIGEMDKAPSLLPRNH